MKDLKSRRKIEVLAQWKLLAAILDLAIETKDLKVAVKYYYNQVVKELYSLNLIEK